MTETTQKKSIAPILGLASVACVIVGVVMLNGEQGERETAKVEVEAQGEATGFIAELKGRTIDLLGGKFHVSIADYPVIGGRDAEHVLIALSDYRSDRIGEHFQNLTNLQRAYGEKLAIVQLPASSDQQGAEVHQHMMTLREIDESIFGALSADIYAGRVQPEPAAILAEITRRIGVQRFADAHKEFHEAIEHRLELVGKVQEEAATRANSAILPQVVVDTEVASGNAVASHYAGMVGRVWGMAPAANLRHLLEDDEVPKLEVSEEKIDLGTLKPNSKVDTTIPIKNAGNVPLKVSWLRLQSGFEIKSMPSGEIAPGATGEVELIVTVPTAGDHLESLVTVHTDGSDVGSTFKFYGRIEG